MLWIWYCPGRDEQIRDACDVALEELERRGFNPMLAQQATFEAADLPDDADDVTPAAEAVVAWYDAEHLAFQHIYKVTGEWPHTATMVLSMERVP